MHPYLFCEGRQGTLKTTTVGKAKSEHVTVGSAGKAFFEAVVELAVSGLTVGDARLVHS